MHASHLSDKIRAMSSVFSRLVLVSAAFVACNTPNPEAAKKDAPADSKTPAADAKTATPPPEATKTPPPEIKAPDPSTNPTGDTKTDDTVPTGGPAEEPPPGDAAAAPADKAKLIEDAKKPKTSDAKAKKALEDAEKAGATARELAEAANARGEALFDDADRAAAFFTWARDKDPTYPEPVFNLAKQSANAGEIPATIELLKEVHKRGGKKLLKQVGFDPTFEIVKDDAEVQKLLK